MWSEKNKNSHLKKVLSDCVGFLLSFSVTLMSWFFWKI